MCNSFDENLSLATRQDDPQWQSFVYWAAQSLVYAEENGISNADSYEMPLVMCFGPDFQRMFRDVIHYSGQYAEMYERHLAQILPRGGRNMLNLPGEEKSSTNPLRYIPPGFVILDY